MSGIPSTRASATTDESMWKTISHRPNDCDLSLLKKTDIILAIKILSFQRSLCMHMQNLHVLCDDLPMASKIFSRWMRRFSALGFSHDSHDSLVEHRWSCSKSTGNGFCEVVCHPPPVDMLKWSSFVRKEETAIQEGDKFWWYFELSWSSNVPLSSMEWYYLPSPFPAIRSDFLEA